MNAFDLSIQGSLKPVALRHHVFELGKQLGISGFLNYRKGMFELYIHAEGEEEIIVKFINQVKQLSKKHKLVCFTEPAKFEDCRNFKILPLKNETGNYSMLINDHSNSILSQNNSKVNPLLDLQPTPIVARKQIPGIKKAILSFKQVGFW